ncbi:hypothetical protein WNY37_12250 [Henriciella sp. AS95]|uniref:hypothetical protein n=1 Tax=Henriciella sp. AS95 TaxID=3135782 RepID=UPI0031777CA7
MTLQNRVDPFGEIHASPSRGLFTGNRGGCFHREDQTLRPTRWSSRQWIICLLEFKGRRRKLMQPGLYTELFFMDEATALAAGHRPCFECRKGDALAFRGALMSRKVFDDTPSVGELDSLIAGEMQARIRQKLPLMRGPAHALPDGAMFAHAGRAWLKWQDKALAWSFNSYEAATDLPSAPVGYLTPSATLEALRGGYLPTLHPSFNQLAA